MSDSNQIHQKIEAIVAEVAEQHAAVLSKRLRQELNGNLGQSAGAGPADLLNAAVVLVQNSTTQTDILKALLDGAAQFSRRAALLIVRGNIATGWHARGFSDNDSLKGFSTDCGTGLAGRVAQNHTPAVADAHEFDPAFVHRFGAPADGNVLLLPLSIKGKVAAVVYADGGQDGASGMNRSAMELLVRVTGLWLEVLSFRKTVPGERPQPEVAHAAAAAVSAPAPVATPAPPLPAAPAEDEAHSKAKRFAKLLVEEIKLYNQEKVAQGRAQKDLYDRLRDDIDKSRATYDRRYAQTITDADYFTQELIRILADNDRATLGANFRW